MDATVVCVVGPGRSGTSLTAGLLGLLGVHLGDADDLVPAKPGNPKGFWEHRRIMLLNERLLRMHGGSGHEPPRWPDGWETSDRVAAERAEAQAIVDSFAGHDRWGWKDPKASSTLSFWQRLLPGMRYVVCVRDPLDVAASVERRGVLERDRTLALWAGHMARTLVATTGRPRILVAYEDYFADRAATVERVARFAGVEPPRPGGERARQVDEFVDDGLWHHRTQLDATMRDGRVPDATRTLYLMTRLLSRTGESCERAGLQRAVDVAAERILHSDNAS